MVIDEILDIGETVSVVKVGDETHLIMTIFLAEVVNETIKSLKG